MKIRREKTLALFVGVCMVLTLCMTSFVTTAEASGFVYVDAPTGTPETDWAYIQSALDSMNPGDTIVLQTGHYKVHRPLVKTGFRGAIVGAGMDETIIEVVKDSEGNRFAAAHMEVYDGWWGEGSEDYIASLFIFGSPEKKLSVADLTVEVNEPDIVEMCYTKIGDDIYYFLDGQNNLLGYELYSFFEIGVADNCDTKFENVRMSGVPDVWSPRFGVGVWFSSGGSHVATGCTFEELGVWAYGVWRVSDAHFRIESNTFDGGFRGVQTFRCDGLGVKISGNSFYDLNEPAVMNFGLDSSQMVIQRNTMVNGEGAIWANNWFTLSKGSSYKIDYNIIDIRQGSWYGGIEIWDQADEKADLVVVQNTIHADEFTAPYGPICMMGVHDAVIANNEFTGAGPAAMFIGVWLPGVGLKIINNDVSGFEVGEGYWDGVPDPIAGIAHIFLGPLSSECIVIPESSADTIFDVGTDNLVVQR
ncbi:MAG: right-handed parallel beta-helix repeat-containing protein [Candidatus Thorarchaeota archaeon]